MTIDSGLFFANKYGTVDELKIPIQFRPTRDVYTHTSGKDGSSMIIFIKTDGGFEIYVNQSKSLPQYANLAYVAV